MSTILFECSYSVFYDNDKKIMIIMITIVIIVRIEMYACISVLLCSSNNICVNTFEWTDCLCLLFILIDFFLSLSLSFDIIIYVLVFVCGFSIDDKQESIQRCDCVCAAANDGAWVGPVFVFVCGAHVTAFVHGREMLDPEPRISPSIASNQFQ